MTCKNTNVELLRAALVTDITAGLTTEDLRQVLADLEVLELELTELVELLELDPIGLGK